MTSSAMSTVRLLAVSLLLLSLARADKASGGPIDCTNCSSDPDKEAICGSDGQTYQNQCRLLCAIPAVTVKHRGHCSTHGTSNSCMLQREMALAQRKTGPGAEDDVTFVPECNQTTGKWRNVQCHKSTGYCWCVGTNDGRPFPGSSVRHRNPNCAKFTRRRSSRRSAQKGSGVGGHGRGILNNNSCTVANRSMFVFNLMATFKSEFARSRTGTSAREANERQVIAWKFSQLDKNGDSVLRKKELRDLKRMVKKVVQPRPCAKLFAKMVDANKDTITTRHEWANYFRRNAQFPVAQAENHGTDLTGNSKTDDADYEEDFDLKRRPNPLDFLSSIHATSFGTSTGGGGGGFSLLSESPSRSNDEEDEEEDEEITIMTSVKDCTSARASAVKAKGKTFVPECNADGTYKEIQCVEAFCWCADPDKGTPMRGTRSTSSVAGDKPDCSQRTSMKPQPSEAPSGPGSRGSSSNKGEHSGDKQNGCPPRKKTRFINELLATFEGELSRERQSRAHVSKEFVARWKFEQADMDSSGVLEKREWPAFRKNLKSVDEAAQVTQPGHVVRRMRKCFIRFIRTCDLNDDKKITMAEWLECSEIVSNVPRPKVAEHQPPPRLPRPLATNDHSSRRRGPNPFSTILISHD